jgi:hypothetical protein
LFFVLCTLRVVQGLLLERRLGAATSLAMLGAAWVPPSRVGSRIS